MSQNHVMRPLSGQVKIHLAQLKKRGLTLCYLMHLMYHYDQLFIEIETYMAWEN